jgi:hypothetical protein
MALARFHALEVDLYRHLEAAGVDIVPKEVLTELWVHYQNSLCRSRIYAGELAALNGLFSENTIPLISFKGPVLAILTRGYMSARESGILIFLSTGTMSSAPPNYSRREASVSTAGGHSGWTLVSLRAANFLSPRTVFASIFTGPSSRRIFFSRPVPRIFLDARDELPSLEARFLPFHPKTLSLRCASMARNMAGLSLIGSAMLRT